MTKQAEKAKPEANEEEQAEVTQSNTLKKYKDAYEPYQTATGNLSLDNGDQIAAMLRGADLPVVLRAAEIAKSFEPGTLVDRYEGRNNGSKRMNAGNILRGVAREDGEYTKEGVAEVKAALKAASKAINSTK